MACERWKAIPGFEGLYSASTFGRIRSEKRKAIGRWGHCQLKEKILVAEKLPLFKNGKSVKPHPRSHWIHLTFIGPVPLGLEVDHKDRNHKNDRPNNLRACTHLENSRNRKYHNRKYHGVHLHGQTHKYQARINIGLFNTEQEAARAYDNVAKKLFGKFAALNFK